MEQLLILPVQFYRMGIKTSIAVTASEDEWNHIYELRLDKAAHKDMRYTMTLIQHELKGEIL